MATPIHTEISVMGLLSLLLWNVHSYVHWWLVFLLTHNIEKMKCTLYFLIMVTFCTFVNNFNKYLHSEVNSNELSLMNSPIENNHELQIYQLLMEYLLYSILSLVLVLFLRFSLSKHFSFTSGSKLLVLCTVIQVLPVLKVNMNTVTHRNVSQYLPNFKKLHLSQLYIDNFESLQCSPWYIDNFKHLNFSQFYIHNFKFTF